MSQFRNVVESYIEEIKKPGTITMGKDIDAIIDESKIICDSWNIDKFFISDNYDFYQSIRESLDESRESKIIEKEKAIDIYRGFREFLLENLLPVQRDYVITQSYMKYPHLVSKNDRVTAFPINKCFDMSIDMKEFGLSGIYTISFAFNDKMINRALCQPGPIICISCDSIDGHVDIDGIKNVFEIPDIIIHEIIHALDDIRSNGKSFLEPGDAPYKRKVENHAYTHNLILVLDDLISHGWSLNPTKLSTRKELLNFLKGLKTSSYKKIISGHIVDTLIDWTTLIDENKFRTMINDVIDYFQGQYKPRGSLSSIK